MRLFRALQDILIADRGSRKGASQHFVTALIGLLRPVFGGWQCASSEVGVEISCIISVIHSISEPSLMFPNEQVFAWDFESLKEVAANPTPRNLLDASAILRRMLLDDGEPLISKVSKPLGVQVLLTVFADAGKVTFTTTTENMPGVTHYYENPDTSISDTANTKG